MPLSDNEFNDILSGLPEQDEFDTVRYIHFCADNVMQSDEIIQNIKSIIKKHNGKIHNIQNKGRLLGDYFFTIKVSNLKLPIIYKLENLDNSIQVI